MGGERTGILAVVGGECQFLAQKKPGTPGLSQDGAGVRPFKGAGIARRKHAGPHPSICGNCTIALATLPAGIRAQPPRGAAALASRWIASSATSKGSSPQKFCLGMSNNRQGTLSLGHLCGRRRQPQHPMRGWARGCYPGLLAASEAADKKRKSADQGYALFLVRRWLSSAWRLLRPSPDLTSCRSRHPCRTRQISARSVTLSSIDPGKFVDYG